MKTPKFPKLIHVTLERLGHDEPYMVVNPGGVFDVDNPDEPIAVYQLVKTGKVEIRKRFVRP